MKMEEAIAIWKVAPEDTRMIRHTLAGHNTISTKGKDTVKTWHAEADYAFDLFDGWRLNEGVPPHCGKAEVICRNGDRFTFVAHIDDSWRIAQFPGDVLLFRPHEEEKPPEEPKPRLYAFRDTEDGDIVLVDNLETYEGYGCYQVIPDEEMAELIRNTPWFAMEDTTDEQ